LYSKIIVNQLRPLNWKYKNKKSHSSIIIYFELVYFIVEKIRQQIYFLKLLTKEHTDIKPLMW